MVLSKKGTEKVHKVCFLLKSHSGSIRKSDIAFLNTGSVRKSPEGFKYFRIGFVSSEA